MTMTGCGGADDLELDLRADQPAQHRVHAADDVAEREQPRAASAWRRLKASSCRVRPAPRSTDCLISVASSRAASSGAELHQQQVGRAHDAHQDVVEVVRDAAGEPADRLELLRLAQLLLERRRSVMSRMKPVMTARLSRAHARDRQLDRELGAVGAQAVSSSWRAGQRSAAGRHVLAERVELLCAIGRRQQQVDVAAEDVDPRVAEHLLGRRVELADVQAADPS